MTNREKDSESSVSRGRQDTRAELLELLENNQNLRQHYLALESEQRRLQERADALEASRAGLAERLAEAEEESHRFSSRLMEVEEQNNKLASLYVASCQLHKTVDRDEALVALMEILINLIGSEDFVIFERDPETGEMTDVVSYGIASNRLEGLDLRSGPIAEAAEKGEIYLADSLESKALGDLVAAIPMRMGSRVHGVIAILALLSHKGGLEPIDHELFDLLASHAARSLCVGRLYGESAGRVAG